MKPLLGTVFNGRPSTLPADGGDGSSASTGGSISGYEPYRGTMTAGGDRTLPGVSADREDRIVLHVDMDCFYAACERRREPSLVGEPVVVGMGYEPGEDTGAVATASYEAREYGVESAQAITTALERLPRRADTEDVADTAIYRPVDMDYYESVSEEVRAVLDDCADTVRAVSIDEAYLDVTDRTAWTVVEGFARHVKQRIEREVGVTASVGAAPTMSAAKIASDHDKPDGLVTVSPEELTDFLAPLPVEDLHGVGPVTARELRDQGIETIGDLAATDRREMTDRFGDRGRELVDRARGDDDREVTPTGRPKSLSRESAFGDAVTDPGRKLDQVRTLADAVADRARREDAKYRTIGVKAVEPPFDVNTRERSLPGPVDDPDLVRSVALDLFEEFVDDAVRKVGVRVSNLAFGGGEQTSLSGYDEATEAPPSDTAGTDAGGADEGGGVGEGGDEGEGSDEDDPGDGTGPAAVTLPVGQARLTDFG